MRAAAGERRMLASQGETYHETDPTARRPAGAGRDRDRRWRPCGADAQVPRLRVGTGAGADADGRDRDEGRLSAVHDIDARPGAVPGRTKPRRCRRGFVVRTDQGAVQAASVSEL